MSFPALKPHIKDWLESRPQTQEEWDAFEKKWFDAEAKSALEALEKTPPQPAAKPVVKRRRFGTSDRFWLDMFFGVLAGWHIEEIHEMQKEIASISGQPLQRVRQVVSHRNSTLDLEPGRNDWKICRAFMEFLHHPETHGAVRMRAASLRRITREEETLIEIGRDFRALMQRLSKVHL